MKGESPLRIPGAALQGVRIYCLTPTSSGIQAGRHRRAAKDGRQRQSRCRPTRGVGKADPVNACYARRRRPDTSGIGFAYQLKRAKARTKTWLPHKGHAVALGRRALPSGSFS